MKSSTLIKLTIAGLVVGLLLSCASVPHPNLVAAQQYVEDAMDKVSAAQKANKFDMKGHAARAKKLMEQALEEIKLAEQTANQ